MLRAPGDRRTQFNPRSLMHRIALVTFPAEDRIDPRSFRNYDQAARSFRITYSKVEGELLFTEHRGLTHVTLNGRIVGVIQVIPFNDGGWPPGSRRAAAFTLGVYVYVIYSPTMGYYHRAWSAYMDCPDPQWSLSDGSMDFYSSKEDAVKAFHKMMSESVDLGTFLPGDARIVRISPFTIEVA